MIPSSLQRTTADTLQQLIDVLAQLDDNAYQQSLPVLSGSSIGKHVRHITEFYLCLFGGVPVKQVNYDARKRNLQLETDVRFAAHTLYSIVREVLSIDTDHALQLRQEYTPGEPIWAGSTLYRELIFNLEHCIHHLATIRIGVNGMRQAYSMPETFGVAPSTIQHQQSLYLQ